MAFGRLKCLVNGKAQLESVTQPLDHIFDLVWIRMMLKLPSKTIGFRGADCHDWGKQQQRGEQNQKEE